MVYLPFLFTTDHRCSRPRLGQMFFELRHAIDVDQHQIHGKVSWGPRDPTETAPRRGTTHRILWLRNIGLHGKEHARIDVNGYNDYHIDMYIYIFVYCPSKNGCRPQPCDGQYIWRTTRTSGRPASSCPFAGSHFQSWESRTKLRYSIWGGS